MRKPAGALFSLFTCLVAPTGFALSGLIHPMKPPKLEGLAITEVLVQAAPGWSPFVEIVNRNPLMGKTLDLSGYQLRTGARGVYLFPSGTKLRPGQFLVVDLGTGSSALRIPKGAGAKVLIAGFRGGFFASGKQGELRLLDRRGGYVDAVVWGPSLVLAETPPEMQEVEEQGLWVSRGAVVMGKSRDGSLGIRRVDAFTWNNHSTTDWEFVDLAQGLNPGTPGPWLGDEHRLRIRVRDPKGYPLKAVQIEVPSKKLSAQTNEEGLALMDGFGGGSWNFHLKKAGYVERWVSLVRKQPYRRGEMQVVLIKEAGRIQGTWEVGPNGGLFQDWTGRLSFRFPKGFLKTKTKIHAVWVDKVYSQWKERGLYDAYLGRGKGVDYVVPLGTLVVTPDLRGQGQVEVTVRAPLMNFAWEGSRELWGTRKKAEVEQIEGDGLALSQAQASVEVVKGEIVSRFSTSRFSSFVLSQKRSRRTVREVKAFLKKRPDHWRVTAGHFDGSETSDTEGDGHATDLWYRNHLNCGGSVTSKVNLTTLVGVSQVIEGGWEVSGSVKAKLAASIPFLVKGETEVGVEGSKHGFWVTTSSDELTMHFEDSKTHGYHFRPCKDDIEMYLLWGLKTVYLGKYHSKTKKFEVSRLKIWTPVGIEDTHQPSKECCFPGEDGKKVCNCKKVPPKKSH